MSSNDNEKWTADIVIVGGGVGGLSCAISLAQKTHHRIRVLERSSSLREAGAGIQCTPSASRILSNWGLGSELEEIATMSDFVDIRSAIDLSGLGLMAANGNGYAKQVYGHPHWLVHRVQYLQVLARHAVALGVTIDCGRKIISVDSANLIITMADAQKIKADLIIGADGIYSETRKSIEAVGLVEPKPSQHFCYRTLIPREKMMSNPLTAPLQENRSSILWLGGSRFYIGYPIAKGEYYNIVFTIPNRGDTPIATYNEPGDLEEMLSECTGWGEIPLAVLKHAESCVKWRLADIDHLASWTSNNGRVVLLGDAAHAMLPHAAAGAVMTIEDAEVLGLCVAACTSAEDLAKATASYQAIRKPRAEHVQDIARANSSVFSLPDGPQQQARDEGLKRARDNLLKQLSGEVPIRIPAVNKDQPFPHPEAVMWLYGYDAAEDAKAYLAAH